MLLINLSLSGNPISGEIRSLKTIAKLAWQMFKSERDNGKETIDFAFACYSEILRNRVREASTATKATAITTIAAVALLSIRSYHVSNTDD